MRKPLILITNDDGPNSPGLIAAIKALRPIARELLVAVPAFQQTSMSRAYPKVPDLGRIETSLLTVDGEPIEINSIVGSPAFCVSYAVLELAKEDIDLCVSGINVGENVGLSLLPSGTVGAAFEADTYDIPSIAASLYASPDQHHSEDFKENDWDAAVHFLNILAKKVLARGYESSVAVWNINIPDSANIETECRITRQSRQNYFVFRRPARDNVNIPAKLPVEIEIDETTLEPDSDVRAVILDKCVSITPLSWDMTSSTELSREPSILE